MKESLKRFMVRKIIGWKSKKVGQGYFGIYKQYPVYAPKNDYKYLVVNTDEPYAPQVFELIKQAEKVKGTWDGPDDFEKFVAEI